MLWQQTLEKPEYKKQKLLTFEEICPLWSRAIMKRRKDMNLNIESYQFCVVGEAYHFACDNIEVSEKNAYNGCIECYVYSRQFNTFIKYRYFGKLGIADEDFEYVKHNFVAHWNEKHL